MMRVISFSELSSRKGIPFSRNHIRRLINERKFPSPMKLGDGPFGTIGWLESEIDAWLKIKAAEREPTNAA